MWLNFNKREVEIIKEAMAAKGRAGQEVLDTITHFQAVVENAEKYKAGAIGILQDQQVEVEQDAVISKGEEPGAYVMAWVWVTDDDAGIEPPGVLDWRPTQ